MAVEIDPALKCTIPRALYYVEKLYKLKYLSMVHFCFEALETCLPRKIKSMFFVTSFFISCRNYFFLPFVYIKIIIFATIECLNNLSTCSWKVGQKMVGRLLESDGNGSHKGSPTTTNFTHQDKSCFRLLPAYIQLSSEELEAFRIYTLQSESAS